MDAKVLPFDPSRYRAGFEPEEIKLEDIEVVGLSGIRRKLFVGESVWVDPFPDGDDLEALQAAYARMQTSTSETEQADAMAIMHDAMSCLILAWNCRDKYGELLPQPHRNPSAFDRMVPAAELALLNRILSGAPDKPDPKESAGSPNTSSPGKARRNR